MFEDTGRVKYRVSIILGDPEAVSGAEDKVKTGGKKFDEQKVRKKNKSRWGQKQYTDQFQTAEQILAPDWAGNLLYISAQSAGSKG